MHDTDVEVSVDRGVIYRDSQCQFPMSRYEMKSGSATTVVYFKSADVGPVALTVRDLSGRLSSTTNSFRVTHPAP